MVDDADRRWVDSMPDAYDRWLTPAVFHPFAVDLARRVGAHAPQRVLELAAGTGVLTRELLRIGGVGDVTSTDLNPAMVDYGRGVAPDATWQQADALRLPFDAGMFDLVVCQFGVMFFPDKPAAFAEARRILAPGGRLVFNTWASVDTHEFAAALVTALGRVFPVDPPTFVAAVPHGYADPGKVVADVRAGGFADVTVETVTLSGQAPSAADIAIGFCTGTPLRAAIEARADLTSTADAVAKEMEAQLGAGAVTGRMTAYVVTAATEAGP